MKLINNSIWIEERIIKCFFLVSYWYAKTRTSCVYGCLMVKMKILLLGSDQLVHGKSFTRISIFFFHLILKVQVHVYIEEGFSFIPNLVFQNNQIIFLRNQSSGMRKFDRKKLFNILIECFLSEPYQNPIRKWKKNGNSL